ncbi:hypothetical protein [Alteromonas sp. CYL-A6]|uniref:hypothetical protein n=1 Tax=Alteromonas nitratireducens TaxID=3390813 RepID=UPI0034C0540E
MATSVDYLNTVVVVRLYGDIDGYDVMAVHRDEAFLDAVRRTGQVLYDYSGADHIRLTEADVVAFAKLAVIEAALTDSFTVGVIPQGDAQLPGVRHYQKLATDAGVCVHISESVAEFINKNQV